MAEKYDIKIGVSGVGEVEHAATNVHTLETSIDKASGAAKKSDKAFEAASDGAAKMADEMSEADRAAWKLADSYGDLDTQMVALGGPVGRLAGRFFEVREAFGKLSVLVGKKKAIFAALAVGLGFLAVAAAAVTAAVAVAGAAVVGLAYKASSAAAKTSVLREALTGSAGAASQLTDTINRVAQDVPVAKEKVGELAEGLYESGKRGAELEEALYAASYEAAGLGDNPGPELIAKRMANLDVIGLKLKDNIADIFSGPSTVAATTKFNRGLSGFVDLFGQNHAEGRALRTLLGTVVDPLLEGLDRVGPLAKQVFRGMIILALDATIAVLEFRNAVIKMVPDEVKAKYKELTAEIDTFAIAVGIGKHIMGLFIASIVIVGVAIGVVVGVVVALGAAIYGICAAFATAVVAVGEFIADAGKALLDFGKSGTEAAKSMVDGLVNGIKSGVGPVVEAVKAMASSAVGAIKSALQIGSPSKLFEGLGEFTGEGFASGIEDQTATVTTALETMVSPPDVEPMALPSGPSDSASGGGGSVSLSNVVFNFHGVKDAEKARASFEETLTSILEGDAVATGAA